MKVIELPFDEYGCLGDDEAAFRNALECRDTLQRTIREIDSHLEYRLRNLVCAYLKYKGGLQDNDEDEHMPPPRQVKFLVREKTIQIYWEVTYCRCCGGEDFSVTLPLEWAWADLEVLEAKWQAQVEAVRQKREDRLAREAEEDRLAQEEQEREEFARLQAKFGDSGLKGEQ